MTNLLVFMFVLLAALVAAIVFLYFVCTTTIRRTRRIRVPVDGPTGPNGSDGLSFTGPTGPTGGGGGGGSSITAFGQSFNSIIDQVLQPSGGVGSAVTFTTSNPTNLNVTIPAPGSNLVLKQAGVYYYFFWISNASNNEAPAPGIRSFALYRNGTQITGSNFSNLDPGSGDPLSNTITISGSGLFTANFNDVIQLRNTSTVQILLAGAANSTQSNISLTLFRIADVVDRWI